MNCACAYNHTAERNLLILLLLRTALAPYWQSLVHLNCACSITIRYYYTRSIKSKWPELVAKYQLTIKFNQRILLLRCRKQKILPQHLLPVPSNFISFNNTNIARLHSSAFNKFQFSILNLEIKDICITIHRLQNDVRFNEQKILTTLPEIIYKQFFFFESQKILRISLSHRNSCKSKFERLIQAQTSLNNDDIGRHCCLIDSWFTNLTDTHIPSAVAKTIIV